MSLLKQVDKGPLLNPFEEFYINRISIIKNVFQNKTRRTKPDVSADI